MVFPLVYGLYQLFNLTCRRTGPGCFLWLFGEDKVDEGGALGDGEVGVDGKGAFLKSEPVFFGWRVVSKKGKRDGGFRGEGGIGYEGGVFAGGDNTDAGFGDRISEWESCRTWKVVPGSASVDFESFASCVVVKRAGVGNWRAGWGK